MNEKVLEIILEAMTELNEQLDENKRLPLDIETPLFGRSGGLDSLGLVNLIVYTEQRIEDEMGVTIPLADERAMSLESSPFATVRSFRDYVVLRLTESGNELTASHSD